MTRRNKSAAVKRAAAFGAAISMMLALPCAAGNNAGLPFLGMTAGAESSGTCGDNITWTLDDEETLAISGTGGMYDYEADEESGDLSPFYGSRCGKITGIEIGAGVTRIGNNAFYLCRDCEDVIIPGNVTDVGNNAFRDCGKLLNVTVENGTESVGSGAFAGCTSLESVSLPGSIAEMGADIFYGCGSLKNIYYAGTEEQWKEIGYNGIGDGNKTLPVIREYLGIDDDVTIRFADGRSDPDDDLIFGGGISVSSATAGAGGTFELYVDIPASDNRADTISLNVEFDPDAFEVVSWYSNNTSSPDYIKDIVSGAWVNHGTGFLTLTASNTTPRIDLSDGIHLTAVMKVKTTASAGDHGITLKKADVCRYDSGLYTYRHFWEPETDHIAVSVTTDAVSGRVTGYGDIGGKVTVTLFDDAGEVIDSMLTAEGNYLFSGLTPGREYTVRASMPHCVPREVSFRAETVAAGIDLIIRRYGDVTGDSIVDAKDATQILRYEAGLPSVIRGSDGIADTYLIKVADITGSGNPSSKDATQILRYDAGLPSYFDKLI